MIYVIIFSLPALILFSYGFLKLMKKIDKERWEREDRKMWANASLEGQRKAAEGDRLKNIIKEAIIEAGVQGEKA